MFFFNECFNLMLAVVLYYLHTSVNTYLWSMTWIFKRYGLLKTLAKTQVQHNHTSACDIYKNMRLLKCRLYKWAAWYARYAGIYGTGYSRSGGNHVYFLSTLYLQAFSFYKFYCTILFRTLDLFAFYVSTYIYFIVFL